MSNLNRFVGSYYENIKRETRRMLRDSSYNSMIEEAIIPKEETVWNHDEVCLHF